MKSRGLLWRRLGKPALLVFLLVVLALSSGLWFLTTAPFQQFARRRLIAEMERATGGRVELAGFHADPLRMRVEVSGLAIHGREAPGDEPYVHVDRLAATISLSRALGGGLGFHSLVLDHPVIRVIFYPDGGTNQPQPRERAAVDFERLFSLSARRLEVRRGVLVWQDRRIPLDFTSNEVSTSLNYSFLHLRYFGRLAIGRAETRYEGFRPAAWAAKANFELDRKGLEVHSLQAQFERSRILAREFHVDFPSLAAKGNYELQLDLAELESIARRRTVNRGLLHLVGDGSWSRGDFRLSGSFDGRDIAWKDEGFSGRDLSAQGKYSIDPDRFSLSQTEGQFLRGSFSADGEIANWRSRATAGKNHEQQGTIRIKTRNLSLAEILAGLGAGLDPVKQLRLAGNVSASTELRWRQSLEYAQATTAADVLPPSRPQGGEIPLAGKAAATYDFHAGNLEISELQANTPATEIHASGSLASRVRISFRSTNVQEWQPVVSYLFPNGAPILVKGRARFMGTAGGSPGNLKLAGRVELEDLSTIIRARRPEGERKLDWDSFAADIEASPSDFSLRNALARRGDSTVRINGNTELSAWNPASDSHFRFELSLENASAGDLAGFAGYDHPVSGRVSGKFDISGIRGRSEGEGNFTLTGGAIEGQAFDSVRASVRLRGSQVEIGSLHMSRAEARIAGNGRYDLGSKSLQAKLEGTNFSLSEAAPLLDSPVKIGGRLDFSAEASGTSSAPQVNADLHIRDLTLNHQAEGEFLIHAASERDRVDISGHSNFKDGEIRIDGSTVLRDQWPAHLTLHFEHMNADPFLNTYVHGQVLRNSLIAGDLVLDGPFRRPGDFNLAGSLSAFYTQAAKTALHNDGPIRFGLSREGLRVERFRILGENTDLSGAGSLHFTGDRSLDFEADGRLDLKLIETYDPDITSSGTLEGGGRVSGTLDAPLIKGRFKIENAGIADINLPSALSDIHGTLLFNQNQATIESLNARTGGGTVGFAGHAELRGRQVSFDLNARVNSVRLRYPPGVSSTADANLNWSGSSAGSLLSGDITVNKLGFTPGFDFGAYLERSAQVSALPQTDPVLNTIRLDLHLSTAPELQMQTSVIRLQGSADLRVRGSAAKPILLGRADVFEGQAYFNGAKYRLERGGVTFSNPAVTTPFLDLQAITRVRDYDVTLSLTGDLSRPNGLKVNYRSDPPLPTNDIIALLAFGQTTEESAQLQQTNQSAFSAQASSAMLTAALNATLNNRAQRLFGNSRIKVDPQGLESETSTVTQSGPAVTIEQQVKDNLTLSYTTDVSQTSQQVIRAEYNLSKNVSIVAIRDQNGVVSFDVTIRRRRR
ncbi:MAG: translocation/assembly module TamB domain-containing protein [Acidobacteria bacterium]|nr:translocation/assembly module TamB domain-containing protein [Acidobacteriota bacterium]